MRAGAAPGRLRDAEGGALVELALVIPFLFLLILNTVNLGACFYACIAVADAARAGAQYTVYNGTAAVGSPTRPTAAQVASMVKGDMAGLPNQSSIEVRVCTNNNSSQTCSGTGSGTVPTDPEPSNFVLASVDVTYTYVPVISAFDFPALGVHLTLPPTAIHRQAIMRMIQ